MFREKKEFGETILEPNMGRVLENWREQKTGSVAGVLWRRQWAKLEVMVENSRKNESVKTEDQLVEIKVW